jgi:8-oxo-dGTP pyrophosphatase MutT (NUDIX family)
MINYELFRRQLDERLAPPHALKIEIDRIPQAAVALILRESRGDAQALIIKRAERDGDPWSGHLALPGGRAEPGDADLLATAARETYEEIGVNLLDGGGFIGQLPLIAPDNPRLPKIEITSLVAVAPQNQTFHLNAEVDDIFWVSVNQLKNDGRSSFYSTRFEGVTQKWPAFPSQAGPIWGITERILMNFLSLLD